MSLINDLDLERPGKNADAVTTLGYTGSLLTTISVVYNGITYTQTFTYNGSNQLTGISAWVPS